MDIFDLPIAQQQAAIAREKAEENANKLKKANARIAELEAQLAAAREALKEFDASKWTLTNGDGLIAYQKLFEALVK